MHLPTRYKSAMSDWSLKTFDTRTSWSLWPEEKHNGWTPKWRTKVSESFLQWICQSLPLNGSPTLWVPIQWWVTTFLVRHQTLSTLWVTISFCDCGTYFRCVWMNFSDRIAVGTITMWPTGYNFSAR
jgi:hypothetical protein